MGLDITVCRMIPTESERYFGESDWKDINKLY